MELVMKNHEIHETGFIYFVYFVVSMTEMPL